MASVLGGTSTVRGKILVYLFSQPGREGHVRQVARQIGASAPAVGKELTRLEEEGIVTARWAGRSKLFRANRLSPIFDQVRQLVRGVKSATDTPLKVRKPTDIKLILESEEGLVESGRVDFSIQELALEKRRRRLNLRKARGRSLGFGTFEGAIDPAHPVNKVGNETLAHWFGVVEPYIDTD